MMNKLASMILYVPFNRDYTVPQDVRNRLTEEEFFNCCFVEAEFNKEIERIQKAEGISIDDAGQGTFIWEDAVAEEIDRLRKYKLSEELFQRWIDESGNGIYCIRGDAGTGKTTYLHNLRYKNKDKSVVWEILDVQSAHTPVAVLSRELEIDNFSSLEGKVIAVFLNNIFHSIFDDSGEDVDIQNNNRSGTIFSTLLQMIRSKRYKPEPDATSRKIARNLTNLYRNYTKNVRVAFPSDEVRWFFDDSPLFSKGAAEIMRNDILNFAALLCEHVTKLLKDHPPVYVLRKLLNLYITILRSKDCSKKYILAIDNVERVIGDHEICNTQMQELIDKLRHMLDAYTENDPEFCQKIQIIILMRNTSSRMSSIPLHRIDFGGHELNLSGWFPIDKIVSKKLKWYENNNISVRSSKLIDELIGGTGFDGCGPGSLQMKLGMLFNNNNRVILTMLTDAIDSVKTTNPHPIEVFDEFKTNQRGMPSQLVRFATRSIIMRIVLDVLKSDGFFANIIAQKASSENEDTVEKNNNDSLRNSHNVAIPNDEEHFVRLGYARKILTILYEHFLRDENNLNTDHRYMLFDELIQQMYGTGEHHVEEYFSENNIYNRDIIAKILYYMNYYNGRKENWLHFIDIQCNIPELNIFDWKELRALIDEHHSIIGIRIMDAGIAFLSFIIQSFEYFSCRVEDKKLPPLLCTIPSLDCLRNCKDIDELDCIFVISKVSKDAFSCIDKMEKRVASGARDILYRRTLKDMLTDHKTRVIHAHRGYINNFGDCIKAYYDGDSRITEEDKNKLDALYSKLNKFREAYMAKL